MSSNEHPDVVAATEIGAVAAPETGEDEPMTEKQAAELRQLCEEKGEEYDASLTKTQAEERIAALKGQDG
ncbi:DUF3072 domain-containing protein [Oceaniglobus roseus]|uniref:DUF3072 domain-containing protein n=1 Tax=Oceaniglobus roseus TaxID=1737570 RepID=UPI000C7EEF65|nr:DUF3072 domain-containing protein [Kandeliimicrobium roseum]